MSAIDQTTSTQATSTLPTTQFPSAQATGAQATTRTTVLRSSEFTCPSCVGKIEKKLRPLPGVTSATVHFSTGRVEVKHDPSVVSVDELVTAVAEVGYRVVPSAF